MCRTQCINHSQNIHIIDGSKSVKKGHFVLWFCKKIYVRNVTNHGSKKWIVMFTSFVRPKVKQSYCCYTRLKFEIEN